MNFYAMKNNGGVAWSPILGQGNFHKASRFGRVVWNIPGQTPAVAGSASVTAADAPVPSGVPRMPFRRLPMIAQPKAPPQQ